MHVPSDLSQVPQSQDAHLVIPTYGPTPFALTRPTGDPLAANTEAIGTHVPEQQDIVDPEVRSSVNALLSQADVSGTELGGLNDSTEHTDDIPEDRPGIPERER
jgi:hypothetical protein